ncbi:GNAT domain [Macleaya cordata]|uniref:GNAT domain n=1 Tax=Macleaya cordata TaxID=56857 RepID=A0A200PZL6_MACCD|nr:GNAT domain [Macleaya cordata]
MAQLKPNPNKYSIFSKTHSRGSPCSSSSCRITSNSKCCGRKIRLILNLGVSSKGVCDERESREKRRKFLLERQRIRGHHVVVPFCSSSPASSSSSSSSSVGFVEEGGEDGNCGIAEGQFGYLLNESGWKVRRLVEEDEEMREVVQVQAEAFHVPMALFNDLFFEFFKAEVLSGLLYKIRNSPPDRYACLVAKPTDASDAFPLAPGRRGLVGVVDVTVLRNEEVLQHLEGAEEYLYVSGIAVFKEFRRQKVATVLLKACDLLSQLWGFEYLALRVYDDDSAARKLYTNAGYRVVSKDPVWMTTWIGRKRRVLMIKRSNSCMYPSNLPNQT